MALKHNLITQLPVLFIVTSLLSCSNNTKEIRSVKTHQDSLNSICQQVINIIETDPYSRYCYYTPEMIRQSLNNRKALLSPDNLPYKLYRINLQVRGGDRPYPLFIYCGANSFMYVFPYNDDFIYHLIYHANKKNIKNCNHKNEEFEYDLRMSLNAERSLNFILSHDSIFKDKNNCRTGCTDSLAKNLIETIYSNGLNKTRIVPSNRDTLFMNFKLLIRERDQLPEDSAQKLIDVFNSKTGHLNTRQNALYYYEGDAYYEILFTRQKSAPQVKIDLINKELYWMPLY